MAELSKAEVLQKVSDFIDGAGVYTMSTVDGDQPKCRPFRAHYLIDGELYFGTGRFKDVFRQMRANSKVEIMAFHPEDNHFMRFTGEVAFEPDYGLAERILDTMPGFRKVYTMEGDMKLEMFHLENATVEFRNMMKCVERYEL